MLRTTTTQRAGRRRVSSVGGRPGVVWAVPALLVFTLFAVVPMIGVAYLSLTSWDGLTDPRFIGLDNWRRLLDDETVRSSFVVTIVLLIGNITVQAPISVLLGTWSAGFQRNRAFLNAVFFAPLLLSTAACAIAWRQILDPNFGIPSKMEWLFTSNLLGDQKSALCVIIVVTSWQFIPFHALLYQAGVRAIPVSLYQAAEIDGAGTVRQFFHITLPQLRNTIVTSTTFMVVGGLTAFDVILVLTNGGPGTDTSILPFRMYQTAFRAYDMGYASAIALLLLILSTAVSIALVRLSGYDKMQSTLEGL